MKRFTMLFFLGMIFGSLGAQTTNDSLALVLEDEIEQLMIQNNIPGLSASIVKNGELIWTMSSGYAHSENNTLVTDQTLFTLASISKLFVATACALLAEQGLLDLEADINEYLPLNVINPNFPDIPITTKKLLIHKSSLHDFESDLQLWDAPGNPIYALDEFCEEYFIDGGDLYVASNWGSTTPDNSPYWYSNAGYTLLGWIIQSASGQPFEDYIRDHILIPLSMNQSGWNYSEVDSADMAMPYDDESTPYGFYSVPEFPAAMLKSNIVELSQFLITYTQAGIYEDAALFSQNTFDMIVPASMTEGFGWWGTDTWWGDPDGEYWSHGGFMNGVRTQLNYYPDDSTGLIILTNGEGNYAEIQDLIESYIPLFEAEIEIPSTVADLKLSTFKINENPVKEMLSITIDKETQSPLELYVIDGKKILSHTFSDRNIHLDISHLDAGIYLVKVGPSQKPIIIF